MWARRCASVLLSIMIATAAWGSEQGRTSGRRAAPGPFPDDVWVVDRATPGLFAVLGGITKPGRFDAIVVTGSGGSRAEVVNHLLEIAPRATLHWVSRDPVPVGLSVDRTPDPGSLISSESAGGVVYCADDALLEFAALLALRIDAALVDRAPSSGAARVIQVGGDAPVQTPGAAGGFTHLESVQRTVDYLNTLATRSAVMVFAAGTLLPEHVLFAFQRGVLLAEVKPPPFSGGDVGSEIDATLTSAAQIRDAVARIPRLDGARPEALVIAGDWTQIPYRFARSTDLELVGCDGCDNGIRTFAADAEYGNLDGDPWGEPEVAVGRLLAYDRDLLAVQTVIGVWHDHGAFEQAPRATFLGVVPSRLRDSVVEGWKASLWDRQMEVRGPENGDPYGVFPFDPDDFLYFADDSDVVAVQAHGAPNVLRDDRTLLNGEILASTSQSARPAFWFITACATARHIAVPYGNTSPSGDKNLVSGLQSRLVYGALMTVEMTASPSGNIYWLPPVLERGVPVGEIVRRAWVRAISAYRGDPGAPEIPSGMAQRRGTDADLTNAWIPAMWVGDPLTAF